MFTVPSTVALVGSRYWSGSGIVHRAAQQLAAAGWQLACGCCMGADAALLAVAEVSPAIARRLKVHAAFGPAGAGALLPVSAVSAVAAAARSGARAIYWAGGPPSVPFRARLAQRTLAMVTTTDTAGVVAFLAPGSRGSRAACLAAAARGLPVVAFWQGPGAPPALSAAGQWVQAAASGFWAQAWRWQPAQLPSPPVPFIHVPYVRGRTR